MSEALRSEKDKWDTNRDGLINFEEFTAYFRAMVQQRMAESGRSNQGGAGGADDNALGPIIILKPEKEEEKRPVVYRSSMLPKELPAWFRQLDTDQDAQIGLYEWKQSGRRRRLLTLALLGLLLRAVVWLWRDLRSVPHGNWHPCAPCGAPIRR